MSYVLLVVGTILLLLSQILTTKKNNEEMASINSSNAGLTKQLNDTHEKLSKTQEMLKQKTEKLEALQEEASSYITGGNSFPVIDISMSHGNLDIEVIHVGKYPIYDVNVTIKDLVKLGQLIKEKEKNAHHTPINYNDFTQRVSIGNISPSQPSVSISSIKIPTDGEIDLRFEITARNSYVEQNVKYKFKADDPPQLLDDAITVNGQKIDRQAVYKMFVRQETNHSEP